MLNYKFNPESTYIVAVTFGPDSMALLDMLQKEGIRPVVCCVNYHVSPTAAEDYGNLRLYCKDKGLEFEYFDTNDLKPEDKLKEGEDFKFWARKVRYGFFHEVYVKRDAEALFLAHQLDDIIEDAAQAAVDSAAAVADAVEDAIDAVEDAVEEPAEEQAAQTVNWYK